MNNRNDGIRSSFLRPTLCRARATLKATDRHFGPTDSPERPHETTYVKNTEILGRMRGRSQTRRNRRSHYCKSQLFLQLLRVFEEIGDAMRHLNSRGHAWKATPRMLTHLANAEQEARDDAEHDMF